MTLAPSPPVSRQRSAAAPREHLLLYPVSWPTYVELNERNGRPGLKMTYTDGRLEIMAPRRDHSAITRLLDHVVTITHRRHAASVGAAAFAGGGVEDENGVPRVDP